MAVPAIPGHPDSTFDVSKQAASELPAFLTRIAETPGEFVIRDDGYRGWTWSYRDIAQMAQIFRSRLRAARVRKGDAVMVCSESRPGWVAAFWGCILEGAVVVPIEPQCSSALFQRILDKVDARLILRGDRVPAFEITATVRTSVWRVSEIESTTGQPPLDSPSVSADDTAEIVFTSGTTGEPKGVIVTHRNLAANLKPIQDEFNPYLKYVRPFQPIRILNLLPMSHLFGQALATFVPPLIPASVVFISSHSPQEISRQIRRRRVCVLVSVPRVLEVLRAFLIRRFPQTIRAANAIDEPWAIRAWRYRYVHRLFGWKFCCIVSGGAPLPPELEAFWTGLGYVVVQGYGLTETAPIISFSHPFHALRGSVGKPLAGVDVKLAPDGEILVRGNNVSPGYFRSPAQTAEAFRRGWLHTGDIGDFTFDGHLVVKGRKKEIIVTPEGFKVFPEDVEEVLKKIPGVRDSAAIGEDRVHAVLVLEPDTDAEVVLRAANKRLEDPQKIASFSIWPTGDLPRTASTGKLRRGEIAEYLRRAPAESPTDSGSDIAELVRKYAPGRVMDANTTLEELGLRSLDRAELVMDLEQKLGARIDETAFASARTIGDLAEQIPAAESEPFPSWNRSKIAQLLRRIALGSILLPLARMFARRLDISGLENIECLSSPVILASNHQSYLDTAVVLASVPARLRHRIAPAMWKEYFNAYFHPSGKSWWQVNSDHLLYFMLTLLFNAFPVPQTDVGARDAIRYMGELVEDGWSILIFPEGERTLTGAVGHFYPGVGMMAAHLGVPVIPVRLSGVDQVWHRNWKWPHPFSRGAIRVRFGAAFYAKAGSYGEIATGIDQAVRGLEI